MLQALNNFQIQTESQKTIELFKNNYIESEQTRKTFEEMSSKLRGVAFCFFNKIFEIIPGKCKIANDSQ